MVTKLFNIAVNDFDANECVRCKRVLIVLLIVTELVVSGTLCIAHCNLTRCQRDPVYCS